MSRSLAALTAVVALALPGLAAAQTCEATITSNDAMQFDTKEMVIDKSCENYTVTLKHVGKLPVNAMGHNWVLTTTENFDGVMRDGMAAGVNNGYLKPNDERVIAATDLIGGGQETKVTFSPSELQEGTDYVFFCSFPGHSSLMKGTLKLGS